MVPEISSANQHGCMIAYRHGCRCFKCRVAYSDYIHEVRKRIKAGTADFVVSGSIVRQHLRELSLNGMGLRAVAECTGISREHLQDIKHGRRLRQSTEVRIMRIHADQLKSAGAWMDAASAHSDVQNMLAAGWTKARIAHEMGIKSPSLKWWGKKKIRVSTRVRLTAVYQRFKQEQRKAA